MGNCICSKSAELTAQKIDLYEQEEDQLFEYIATYFAKFPSQETITIKIKKSLIKNVFDIQGQISQRAIQLNTSLDDIVNEIRKLTKKRFVLLNLQQDPNIAENLIIVLANEQVVQRYDLSENTFVKPQCFSIKKENIFMRDPEIREEQLLNLVRDFYIDTNSLVVGGYQDQKDPTQYYFILFSSHDSLDFGAKFVTPYFLSIECVENLDELENVIDAYEDSILQAILSLKDGEKQYYYLIFKDLEYITLRSGYQYHAEPFTSKDLQQLRLRNSKINNIQYANDKLYYISYGQYKHSTMNLDAAQPAQKRGKTLFIPRKIRESIKVKESIRQPAIQQQSQQNEQHQEEEKIDDHQEFIQFQQQKTVVPHRKTLLVQHNLQALDAIQEDEEIQRENIIKEDNDEYSQYSQSQYVKPNYQKDEQQSDTDSDNDLVQELALIQASINRQDHLFTQSTIRGDRRYTVQASKQESLHKQQTQYQQDEDYQQEIERNIEIDDDLISHESFQTVLLGNGHYGSIQEQLENLQPEERKRLLTIHRQTLRQKANQKELSIDEQIQNNLRERSDTIIHNKYEAQDNQFMQDEFLNERRNTIHNKGQMQQHLQQEEQDSNPSNETRMERSGTIIQKQTVNKYQSERLENTRRGTVKFAKEQEQNQIGYEKNKTSAENDNTPYIEELKYNQKDEVSSFITEFFSPQQRYFLNEENALVGDSVCATLDNVSKVKKVGDYYIHQDIQLEQVNQQTLSFKVEGKQDLEKVFGVQLEYVGIMDHWKLFRLIHTEKEAFIYLSLCEQVVANCMYEVQFYKSLRRQDELYCEEVVFLQNNQIHNYAVVVARPYLDLQSLLLIWNSSQLCARKQENYKASKMNFILIQLLEILKGHQDAKVNHGHIKLSSVFIDMKTYKVTLGSYCFATQVGQQQRRGFIKSANSKSKSSDIGDLNEFILQKLQEQIKQSQVSIVKNIDWSLNQTKNQLDLKELIETLIIEEKSVNLAIDNIQQYIPLNDDIRSLYAITQDQQPTLESLQKAKMISTKLQISKSLFYSLGIKQSLQLVNSKATDCHYILLQVIQDQIEGGRILQALELLNQYDSYIRSQKDMIGVYLRWIKADLNNEEYKCEEYASLSKRQQVQIALLSWQNYDLKLIEQAENNIRDIDHNISPMLKLFQLVKQKKPMDLQCDLSDLPSYFQAKLSLNATPYYESSPKRADTVNHFRVINIFKTIKNLLSMMVYHNLVVPLEQYESRNLHQTVYQYGLDLFSTTYEMKNKVHDTFSAAYQTLYKEHLLEPVVDHLTNRTFTQFKSTKDYRTSIFSRFNFLLMLMLEEIQKQGDDNLQAQYQKQFNPDSYILLVKHQHQTPSEFLEYLSMLVGLRDNNKERIKYLEQQFI